MHASSALRPNKPLKPTRLWACLPGGAASAHKHAVLWPCTQSAMQLMAGVGRHERRSPMRATVLRMALACLSLGAVISCKDQTGVRYPGNGVPWFSRDAPVKEVNEGLFAYLREMPGFRFAAGVMVFSDAPAVRYVHPQPLVTEHFAMNIPIRVTKGECRISLGPTTVSVRPEAVSVFQEGEALQSFAVSLAGIGVFAFPYDSYPNTGLNLNSRSGPSAHASVAIPVPAIISVQCADQSSGAFGASIGSQGVEAPGARA